MYMLGFNFIPGSNFNWAYFHMYYTEYLFVPKRKAVPGKGLTATVHNWNESFTHIEHRQHLDGAIGREEWLNIPIPILNIYFRLRGFQSSSLLIHFRRYGLNNCSHCSIVWYRTYPICDAPLFEIGAAQLRFVTKMVTKSLLLCVNRSPIRCGSGAGAKAIGHTNVNIP